MIQASTKCDAQLAMIPTIRCGQRRVRRTSNLNHGFTLVEVVVSMLVAAVMFAAALSTLAAARAGQVHIAQTSAAMPLAQAKMAELMAQPFDDLAADDGKVEAAIPNRPGWSRQVTVKPVGPDDLTAISAVDTQLVRIVVTVQRGDAVLADLVALRAEARGRWQDDAEVP